MNWNMWFRVYGLIYHVPLWKGEFKWAIRANAHFDSIFTVVTLWGENVMLASEQQSWNKSLPHTVGTSWRDCDQQLEDDDKYQATSWDSKEERVVLSSVGYLARLVTNLADGGDELPAFKMLFHGWTVSGRGAQLNAFNGISIITY